MPTAETDAGKPVDITPEDAAAAAEFRQSLDETGPDEKQTPKRQPRSESESGSKSRARTAKAPAEKARTTDKAEQVKADYTADAQQAVGMAWTALAAIPATQPYALVVNVNADPLTAALAEGAKHSKTIRSFVASGESSWILALAGVGLNMGMQAWQIARDPELRARARESTAEQFKAALGAKGIEVPESSREPAAA